MAWWYNQLQNVPVKEMAQLHTEWFTSEESSDDSPEPEESLPVFSLEQINAYLVHHKRPDPEPALPAQFREVAKMLSESLTESRCRICDKIETAHGGGHYKSARHYIRTNQWLEKRLKTTDPDVIRKVFCAPCNLALHQQTPDAHYSSEAHRRCAKLYCGRCQVTLSTYEVMQKHVFSKRHVKRRLTTTTTMYVPACEGALPNDSSSPNDEQGNGNQVHLTERLRDMIGPAKCLICKAFSETHLYSKSHIKRVMHWIQTNDTNRQFYPDNVSRLYCAACDFVLLNERIESDHYASALHQRNAAKYCSQCQRRLRNLTKHVRSKQHRNAVMQDKYRKRKDYINIDKEESDTDSQSEQEADSDDMPEESEAPTLDPTQEENDDSILQNRILRQLESIANKVLVFKTVSSEHALTLLRRLNEELASIPKMNQPNCMFHSSPPKLKNDRIRMELERLKAILGPSNRHRLPLIEALNLLGHFLKDLVHNSTNFDWNAPVTFRWSHCTEKLLSELLDITQNQVLQKQGVLPVLEQFNAHLERVMERKGNEVILEMSSN